MKPIIDMLRLVLCRLGIALTVLLAGLPLSLRAGSYVHPEYHQEQPDHMKNKGGRKFHPERFIKEVRAYISQEAELTEKEAAAFFPVFFEMKAKQRGLHRQKGRALRLAAERDLSEKECSRVLNEIQQLDNKALRMEKDYMARFERIIGARKLVKVLQADRKFGRRMFRQMTCPVKK